MALKVVMSWFLNQRFAYRLFIVGYSQEQHIQGSEGSRTGQREEANCGTERRQDLEKAPQRPLEGG